MPAGERSSRNRYYEKTCEWCGSNWETRTLSSRCCTPRCAALLRERELPPGTPGTRRKREYSPEIIDRVREMYDRGMTREEMKRVLGPNPGFSLQIVLRRHISRRRQPSAEPGNWERPVLRQVPAGENHPQWKGKDASYQAFHVRVANRRGKPCYCACCDSTQPELCYDWANLTGDYANIFDYIRLCRVCHRDFDARRRTADHSALTRGNIAVQESGPDLAPALAEACPRC